MARGNSGPGSRSKSRNSSSKSGSRSSSSKSSSRSNRSRASSNGKGAGKDVPDFSVTDPEELEEAVDVFVDVPVVRVEEIKFELDDLRAHLALLAEAGHFVQLTAAARGERGKAGWNCQKWKTEGRAA